MAAHHRRKLVRNDMYTLAYELPELQRVTVSEFKNLVRTGDTFLTDHFIPKIGRLITWGQKRMLTRFGYSPVIAEALSRYVHAGMVTSVDTLAGFEAVMPVLGDVDIVKDYGDSELMILRPSPALNADEKRAIAHDIQTWRGSKYDAKQYAVYPFYMAYGWVPKWWSRIWDNPDAPVCSGLCVRLYQAARRMTYIDDYEMYPPARMPMIRNMRVIGRYRLSDAQHDQA
jgi:hypothetical protein